MPAAEDGPAVESPSLDSSVLELLSLRMFMPSLLESGGFSEESNLAGTVVGNAAPPLSLPLVVSLGGVGMGDALVLSVVGVSACDMRVVGGIGGGCGCLPWSKLNCFFSCIARGGGCTCPIMAVVPKSVEVDTSSLGRFTSEAPMEEVRNG